jgi:hypothetical protein
MEIQAQPGNADMSLDCPLQGASYPSIFSTQRAMAELSVRPVMTSRFNARTRIAVRALKITASFEPGLPGTLENIVSHAMILRAFNH